MNGKLTLAAVLWLSGFVAGIVLVGRWQRLGGIEFEMPTPEPVSDDASPKGKIERGARRVAGPVLAGAKADLLTVRNVTHKVTRRVTSTSAGPDTAAVN